MLTRPHGAALPSVVAPALRPYQSDAVERLRAAIRTGQRRILVVSPTGSGKTVLASSMIASAIARGRKVLFTAHRREILDQTFRKLLDFGLPHESLSVVMGNDPRFRPHAPVQIASIQTLNNREKPPADLVFFDEAHRAISQSYLMLAAQYPDAVNIGLTASPWRADGKGLREIYTSLQVVATPADLIALGFLVEPQTWTVPAGQLPDLASVSRKGGDYDDVELAQAVDRKQLVGDIVDHWQRRAGNRRTVCFAVSVEHSQHIVAQFLAAGIPAEHLDGETPTGMRDAILARLASGVTRVVSNCAVLQEGWDSPVVKCAILARPTLSLALHIQQAGRILRPYAPGPGLPSETAVILDHAGNCTKHGLPQDPRDYSLEPRRKRQGVTAPATKTCNQCYAIYAAGTTQCPRCGVTPEAPAPKPLEHVAGELVEAKQVSVADRRATFEYLCNLAVRRGYKPGYVLYAYKAKFGQLPPTQWSARKRIAELTAVAA